MTIGLDLGYELDLEFSGLNIIYYIIWHNDPIAMIERMNMLIEH